MPVPWILRLRKKIARSIFLWLLPMVGTFFRLFTHRVSMETGVKKNPKSYLDVPGPGSERIKGELGSVGLFHPNII